MQKTLNRQQLRHVNFLVVDDHYNMRQLWVTILSSFGVNRIFEAATAKEAQNVIQNEQIDIAVVDMLLDDMTGIDLTLLIRREAESKNPLLPVIACTADTRKSVVYRLLDCGVDEILTKPVSPMAAWQRIVAIINSRRDFVRTATYFGPDRRRHKDPKYKGPERRDKFML